MKLFLFALLISNSAFAVTTTTLGNSKPLNLPDFSNLAKKPESGSSGFVAFSCKDDRDNTLKKGDVGFDECIAKSQDAASKAQTGKK